MKSNTSRLLFPLAVLILGLLIATTLPASALGPVKNFNIIDYVFAVDGEEPEIVIINADKSRKQGYIELDDVPAALLVDEKNALVIASDVVGDRLWFADPAKRQVVKEIQLSIKPHLMAIDPDEEYLVVADWMEGVVEFISLPGGEVLGRIEGLKGAHELRFNTSVTGVVSLYVSIVDRPEIVVIDPYDMKVNSRITLKGERGIIQLGISGTTQFAMAVSVPSQEALLHPIDLKTGQPLDPITLPAPVSRAYQDSFGRYFFLPSAWDGRVWVYDIRKREIIKTLEFDGPVTGIAPGFLGTTIYALSAREATVWGVDLENFDTINTLWVLEAGPYNIISHDQTGKVFISIEEEMRIMSLDTHVNKGQDPIINVITLPDRMPMLLVSAGGLAFCQ